MLFFFQSTLNLHKDPLTLANTSLKITNSSVSISLKLQKNFVHGTLKIFEQVVPQRT